MKVFKFGGASVRDAAGIRNLRKIVSGETEELIIVLSAFGKTTNALEKVLKSWYSGTDDFSGQLWEVYGYHESITEELFGPKQKITEKLKASFLDIERYLGKTLKGDYDFDYDQLVSWGEIWSTMIVSEYLQTSGLDVKWIDIRGRLVTDDRYRDANILWDESTVELKKIIDFSSHRIFLTQGFIGGTKNGYSTTLGREGSDYTAAILASIFDAGKVVVWKDVPGILNADPKWLPGARKLSEISYKEAVEMTFSGAKVIHPKTIKPLHNKNIPLYVKSFINPEDEGTVINASPSIERVFPIFIRKENQLLLSLLPKDFSFVMGDNLGRVFHLFLQHKVKVNLVEAGAVSIDVCVDDERIKINSLLDDLQEEFSAVYNECAEILSIRHYTPEAIESITKGREILLEQRTRSTVRFVVRIQKL
jgi:aspartate kinase